MTHVIPDWPAPNHIMALTTTRQSWGLDNTCYPPPAEREKLQSLFSLPEDPIWLRQAHGNHVMMALPENKDSTADAVFTTTPNRVCVILTADCLPILICDRQGTCVANIHAGWRGLASGIIEQTLDRLPAHSQDLLVWLGPAIGPEKFEVGEDVYSIFTTSHPQASTAFKPHCPGKWLANLYDLARLRLHRRGIRAIYGGNFCTYTQSNLFFSYRRDHGQTGRMATLIWMTA